MKKILIVLVALFVTFPDLSAQSAVDKFPVLIDTDCAPDDLRAICMFAAIREAEILAITTSDGALSPAEGQVKVTQLIRTLPDMDMPVAAGRELNLASPSWRDYCRQVPWGNVQEPGETGEISASDLIAGQVTHSEEPVIFVCMGPLTNLYDALKDSPEIKKNLKRILWYNDKIRPSSGTNYSRDPQAAEYILSQDLNIHILSNLSEGGAAFDLDLLQSVEKITTPYAQSIIESHNFPMVYERITSGHLQLWDDLLPVYTLYPELFDIQPLINEPNISVTKAFSPLAVIEKMKDILSRVYVTEKNIIFERFPADPELVRFDVAESMDEIINKYGKEEWRICVLTSEIHGHLGIYSVVGAKMGLKAREIFNVGIDRLRVISYAGNIPPVSCLNDGLQISTGATLGQGTISISKDPEIQPRAIFSYEDRRIELRLKEKYKDQIETDISEGILSYGNLTSGYWKLIRKLALKYWVEWDRNEIFDLVISE